MDNAYNVSRTLYAGYNFTLSTFAVTPITLAKTYNGKRTYTLDGSVMLSLALTKKNQVGEYKNNAIFISQETHYKTIVFLREIRKWFHDETFQDLFYLDAGKEIHLNNDKAKEMQATLVLSRPGIEPKKMLRAKPCTAQVNQTLVVEGISFQFNETGGYCIVPYNEIDTLYSLLRGFSFQQELLMYLDLATRLDDLKYREEGNSWNQNNQTAQGTVNYNRSVWDVKGSNKKG